MKLTLILPLLLGAVVIAAVPKKRAIGPCEPYAEVCRHCTDCSACKHCSKDGGKCSVCFKK